MRPIRLDQHLEENSTAPAVRKGRPISNNLIEWKKESGCGGIQMKKVLRFIVLMAMATLLVGCQGRVLFNVDVPIVIEPAPPRYQAEAWGYLSYDPRDHHIRYTVGRNESRYYEPLRDAKVTVVGTGMSVYTDRDGYFYMRGVPHGRLTLLVEHRWVGPHNGVYITTSSR